MNRYLASIAIAGIILASCAGPPPATLSAGAISLCTAAANSLQVLAVARSQGKLSAAQVDAVRAAERLVDPVCMAPTPPTDAVDAAGKLAQGLAGLATVQRGI